MTLRLKFLVLIGLVAAAVIVSLATAIWSASLEKSATRNLLALPTTLEELARIRRCSDTLRNAFPQPDAITVEQHDNARDAAADLRAAWQRLRDDPTFPAWTGVTGSAALHSAIADVADPPTDTGTDDNRLNRLDQLVNYSERQALNHATRQLEDNQRLRAHILRANLFAILGAVLMSALAWILLHRWVVTPVSELRVAAARMARGDFEHRLAVTGHDEIAQLNAEVNHMAGMIVTMQRERIEQERFAAIGQMVRRLAHNLRNPLAGIRGLAELTRDELTDDDLRANQQRIVTSVDRFEQWLAELLDVTSPLQLRLEPHDPVRWISDLVDAHRPMAQTRAVHLDLDVTHAPPSATFDARHLGHAVVAILSNAIEACRREGHVTLRLTPHTDPRHWRLHIADQGEGIPPELIDRIFAAHFTTKASGNGIGLAVAQQIIRAHQGHITVDGGRHPSRPADSSPGAAFDIILPLDATPTTTDRRAKADNLENSQWPKF